MVQFWVVIVFIVVKTNQFQFHYGAILGETVPSQHYPIDDFNSTMVQFWAFLASLSNGLFSISIPLWCNFGTISDLGFKKIANLFQFHYGAILGIRIFKNHDMGLVFQFHYGAILGFCTNAEPEENWQEISIPLWCNFGRY